MKLATAPFFLLALPLNESFTLKQPRSPLPRSFAASPEDKTAVSHKKHTSCYLISYSVQFSNEN